LLLKGDLATCSNLRYHGRLSLRALLLQPLYC